MMIVTEFTCPACDTTIRGKFQQNEFATLSGEKLEFLRMFIKARGNLSEVAKEMGVSYPTARSRFDDLLAALGYREARRASPEVTRVLDMLERGEISVEEAERLMRNE